MSMIYEVRVITTPGGYDELEVTAATKAEAFSKSKRISRRRDVYEVCLWEFANGLGDDFTHQWFFKDGKMTWDMGGN